MSDFKGKNQNARPRTPMSDYRNQLAGPIQNGATLPSNFFMTLNGSNQIAICVNTNVKEDENYGRFDIVMPLSAAYQVLATLRYLMENPTQTKLGYAVKDYGFIREGGKGKRTDQPIVKGRVICGRDDNGQLYIGLALKNKQNIKFGFVMANFNEVVGADGQAMGLDIQSHIACSAFVVQYEHMLPHILNKFWKEEEKKEGNTGGGNGGGYNNNRGGNNGGGGGYNNNRGGNSGGGNGGGKPSNDFDDDLPDDF